MNNEVITIRRVSNGFIIEGFHASPPRYCEAEQLQVAVDPADLAKQVKKWGNTEPEKDAK